MTVVNFLDTSVLIHHVVALSLIVSIDCSVLCSRVEMDMIDCDVVSPPCVNTYAEWYDTARSTIFYATIEYYIGNQGEKETDGRRSEGWRTAPVQLRHATKVPFERREYFL